MVLYEWFCSYFYTCWEAAGWFCVVFSDLDPCRLQICVDKNTSFLLSCSLGLTRCLFWQEEVVVLSWKADLSLVILSHQSTFCYQMCNSFVSWVNPLQHPENFDYIFSMLNSSWKRLAGRCEQLRKYDVYCFLVWIFLVKHDSLCFSKDVWADNNLQECNCRNIVTSFFWKLKSYATWKNRKIGFFFALNCLKLARAQKYWCRYFIHLFLKFEIFIWIKVKFIGLLMLFFLRYFFFFSR